MVTMSVTRLRSASRCAVPAAGGARPSWTAPCGLPTRPSRLRQSLEVQHPPDQEDFLLNATSATPSQPSQPVPVLAFTKQLLDQLATPLREPVGGTARAHPNPRVGGGASAIFHGDVRVDLTREHRFDEVLVKETLVGPERRRCEGQLAFRALEERQTARLLGRRPLEDVDPEAEEKAMAVLHERVDRVAGIRAGTRTAFRHEPAIGVGGRPVGGITALLAAEVHRAIARILVLAVLRPILRPQAALVLFGVEGDFERDETLVVGVRADQGTVGEALMRAHASRQRLT